MIVRVLSLTPESQNMTISEQEKNAVIKCSDKKSVFNPLVPGGHLRVICS